MASHLLAKDGDLRFPMDSHNWAESGAEVGPVMSSCACVGAGPTTFLVDGMVVTDGDDDSWQLASGGP